MEESQPFNIVIHGTPEQALLKEFIYERHWDLIPDALEIPKTKKKGWKLIFYKDEDKNFFDEIKKLNFKNIAIICFDNGEARDELIKNFIIEFMQSKKPYKLFPYFILFKSLDELIEIKLNELLNNIKDKNDDFEIYKMNLIFASKENSLEPYLSKIYKIYCSFTNLIIKADKEINEFNRNEDYKRVLDTIKRDPIMLESINDISKVYDELIEKTEYNNIVLSFNLSLDDCNNLLKTTFDKFKEFLSNDEHPFFIFYTNDANITKEKIYETIYNEQKEEDNTWKIDIRNILVINSIEEIYNTIIKVHSYFNELEYKENFDYDPSCTINFLFAGATGSGKSTLINRLLGEKRTFVSHRNKTKTFNTYFHRYFPFQFYDTPGFEIGKDEENKALTKNIENNDKFAKIKEKTHVVFYILNESNKILNDIELEFINDILDKKILIFIIWNYHEKKYLGRYKNELKEKIKKKFSNKERKDYLIKHNYFVNLLDENCKEIGIIINHISKEFAESQKINKEIISKFEEFKKEDEQFFNNNEEIENLINNLNKNEIDIHIDPDLNKKIDGAKLENLKNEFYKKSEKSIFLNGNIKDIIKSKREEAENLLGGITGYKFSNFFMGAIPIPLLDKKLTKDSRVKLINQIFEIYSPVIEFIKKNNKEKKIDKNEEQVKRATANLIGDATGIIGGLAFAGKNVVKFIPELATGIAGVIILAATSVGTGVKSVFDVDKLGKQIIDYLEQEIKKLNVSEIYYERAKKYCKAIEKLKKFESYFNGQYLFKYDCDINKEN
jgi:GTPase Era involved in 16S rRNA processing